MRRDLDRLPEDPLEGKADERIRQVLSETPRPDTPRAIQSRVFARIRRRRMMVRVACAAVVTISLGAAGLTSLWRSDRGPDTVPIARQDDVALESSDDSPDSWLETLYCEVLSAPPPVVTLDLVAKDQYAMLDQLKSLDGVRK